jgi:hypothetical protein
MEPKHERCTECGGGLNLHEPDPDPETLRNVFGAEIGLLCEASLKRPRLPSFGTLSSFEHGLLFLPDLRELPTGGLAAVEGHRPKSGSASIPFWNLFARRTAPEQITALEPRPPITAGEAASRFLDTPGALFIPQDSILRMVHRGTLLRIERKPGRTVAFRIENAAAVIRDGFLELHSRPGWKRIVNRD